MRVQLLSMAFGLLMLPMAAGEPAETVDGEQRETPPRGTSSGPKEAGVVEETGAEPGAGKPPADGESFDLEAGLKRLGHEEFQKRRAAQEDLLAWGRRDPDPRGTRETRASSERSTSVSSPAPRTSTLSVTTAAAQNDSRPVVEVGSVACHCSLKTGSR